jgi:hypothetical protein
VSLNNSKDKILKTDMPSDLILDRLRNQKYVNTFKNPEVFPLTQNKGRKTFHTHDHSTSKFMQGVLFDPHVKEQELVEYKHMLQRQAKGPLIPPEKLLEYEEKINKAYDRKELNRKLRGLSNDNFFKYKDFHGSGPEKITESPNKYHPDLKRVYTQKVAGFKTELSNGTKSKKNESPFEWKMDVKLPSKPFRDRYKFVSNEVNGKIKILPSDPNAFLAMTDYFQRDRKIKDPFMTIYNPKSKNYPLAKSNTIVIPSNKQIPNLHLSKSTKKLIDPPLTSREDLVKQKHANFFTKLLPKIKTQRFKKAENWRMKKHRERGQSLSKVRFF